MNSKNYQGQIKEYIVQLSRVYFAQKLICFFFINQFNSAQKSWISDKNVERIYIDFSLLEELLCYLNLSNKFLPPSKSVTKYWKVGFLQYT